MRNPDREPFVAERAERFLAAARQWDDSAARHVLEDDPEVATFDAFTAACCSLPDPLAAAVANDPAIVHSTRGGAGWTPLQYVSQSAMHRRGPTFAAGAERCAEILLAAGADPNVATGFHGDPQAKLTAVFRAAAIGNALVLRRLLEAGGDPNDDESMYHAAEHDHRECLELLVKHGGLVDGRRESRWNNTPLYFLAGYVEGNQGTAPATAGMQWLLEHGADPDIPSGDGRDTPLLTMIERGRAVEALAMLLDHGADPNLARADGLTPYAAAVRSGHTAAAELLVVRGARPEASAADEFYGACQRGDREAARGALARDPSLRPGQSSEDRERLCWAAEWGRIDAVRLMVELGFDLGAQPERGGTALHRAAWVGRTDVVRALIAMGVPLDVRDSTFGSSALGWAAHGSKHCRDADEDYLATIDALIDAGSRFEDSINRWQALPEELASERVAARLRERGFGRPS